MRKLCAFLPLLLAGVATADFVDEFKQLEAAGDREKTEAFLAERAGKERANADYYATAANYWWGLSQEIAVTTKPAEGDDVAIADPETGAAVGSISRLGEAHPEIPKKALDLLREGVKRFPLRLDLVLGLATVQRESGQQEQAVETLIAMLHLAKKDPAALRWSKDARLPAEPGTMIPEAIQGHTAGLFQEESEGADAQCAKLLDAVIDAFPDHPYAYNMRAALASAHGDQAKVLENLELAAQKAPKDPLIVRNLAKASRDAGKTSKALEMYTRLAELEEADEGLKAEAREALRELKDEGKEMVPDAGEGR